MANCDLAIIGNGMLGYAVAFALTRRAPGMKIAIVGPRRRPGSASAAAGAMLNVFGEIEKGSRAHPLQRAKFALAREALALWPEWHAQIAEAAGAPGEVGVVPGTVILRPSGDTANYEAIRAALDEAGERYTIIDPGGLAGYRPGGARATEAIHIPGEGRMDPRGLFGLFERAFSRAGSVTLIDGTAASVGPETVRLKDGGALAAPRILLAAGAESGRLLAGVPALTGRIQALYYGIGVALLFRAEGAPPSEVLRVDDPAFDHGVHLVPQPNGEIYVGASNDVVSAPEHAPRRERIEELRRAAATHFDAALASAAPRALLGFRPVTADGYPLIGETSVSGLFVLTGTRRDGLHLSPVYARDMAERILGGAGFIRGFEPERLH